MTTRAETRRRNRHRSGLVALAAVLIGGGLGGGATGDDIVREGYPTADDVDPVRELDKEAGPSLPRTVAAAVDATGPRLRAADGVEAHSDVAARAAVASGRTEPDGRADMIAPRSGVGRSGGGAAADEEEQEPATRFKRRPYVAIGGGAAQVEPRSPSAALTVAEDTSGAFELGLGYDITRWLSAELHAADLGAAGIEFLGTDVGDIDYQVYGATAVFYLFNDRDGFVPFTSSRDGTHRREGLSLFGRFGIGGLSNDSDRVSYRRDHATHAVFGAGLEYGFRNGFALRAEAQAFDTDARYLGVGVLKRFGRSTYPPVVASRPAVEPPVTPPPAPVAPTVEPPALDALDMPIVYFAFDRSALTSRARDTLDAFAEAMEGDERVIAIDGHTDWIGPETYNEGLSDRRADAVRDYLVSRGMDPARLIARGFGETRPITRNTSAEGRALNRRAEIRPEE